MKKLIIFLSVFLLLISCSTSRFVSSGVNMEEIQSMLKFDPLASVQLIQDGDVGHFDELVSMAAVETLDESLAVFSDKLMLSHKEINLDNESDEIRLKVEMLRLLRAFIEGYNIQEVAITPLIDSILVANNERFGLIVYQNGYLRTRLNYKEAVLKRMITDNNGIRNFDLPPSSASSVVHVLIVDSEKKNVAFYNSNERKDAESIDKKGVIKQLEVLFADYF